MSIDRGARSVPLRIGDPEARRVNEKPAVQCKVPPGKGQGGAGRSSRGVVSMDTIRRADEPRQQASSIERVRKGSTAPWRDDRSRSCSNGGSRWRMSMKRARKRRRFGWYPPSPLPLGGTLAGLLRIDLSGAITTIEIPVVMIAKHD